MVRTRPAAPQENIDRLQLLGHPRAAKDRPHCLSVAHSTLYRPGSHIPLCADRAGLRRGCNGDATAYDIPGAEPFSHDGELCSFDAFLKVYGIEDAALDALALIVRGADTARLELTAQSPGLLAVSLGLSSIYAGDHAMLERGMTVYDALYAWCRDCRDQGHDWNPSAMAVPKPL